MRLGRAGTLVDNGKVDPRAFAPRNRDVTPGALLERLRRAVPSEDVVVVHGDATLSNMIVGNDLSVGFIDCGHAGRADPYVDLALVTEGLAERFGTAMADRFMGATTESRAERTQGRLFPDLYELF